MSRRRVRRCHGRHGVAQQVPAPAQDHKHAGTCQCTGPQERVSEEIRRRERVIRIFPNDEAALRLISALLADRNEAWQGRHYLDMDEFMEWAAAKKMQNEIANNVVAMSS